jgi:DNA-binding CsgD family transcriptional regulator
MDLTERELEVLELCTRPGGSRRATAHALGVTVHTVDRHLGAAYRKLGVDHLGAAARLVWGPNGPSTTPTSVTGGDEDTL